MSANVHETCVPYDLGQNELSLSSLYRELVTPINPNAFPDIRDAQLYIHSDGFIINAEGWYHPDERLVGEVMYAPDHLGNRQIFDRTYRKVTLLPGTHTPVAYADRGRLLAVYRPEFDQTTVNPYFARYKQIFHRDKLAAYISNEHVFNTLMPRLQEEGNQVVEDIAGIGSLLSLEIASVQKGFTGAPSFGQLHQLHDLDIVFSGSLNENHAIAGAMRKLVRQSPERRLQEGGKGWNIRFFNDRNTLICSFFTYKNADDAPLRDFSMEIIDEDTTLEGTVSDDMHNVYTPTILGLEKTRILRMGDAIVQKAIKKPVRLVAYHTATRGECFEGDRVRARGALVRIVASGQEELALCVIDREGIRNQTPTWEGFYEDAA
jgi:predicted nucleotidyltransferase